VAAAHLNAYTCTPRTQCRGAYTRHILGQSQRRAATEEAERLTVTLVNPHPSHTSIALGRGDEFHSESGAEIGALVDNTIDRIYVHCGQHWKENRANVAFFSFSAKTFRLFFVFSSLFTTFAPDLTLLLTLYPTKQAL
jgi:hypothetical protein